MGIQNPIPDSHEFSTYEPGSMTPDMTHVGTFRGRYYMEHLVKSKSHPCNPPSITMTDEYYNAVDQILDEDYVDNIFLYDDEADKDVEFEQVALIPIDDDVYVILKPVTPVDGVGENEALAFRIDFAPTEEEEDILVVIDDDELVTRIFDEYYELLKEEEESE